MGGATLSSKKIAVRGNGQAAEPPRSIKYTIVDSMYGQVLVGMTEQDWLCCMLLDPSIKSHARIDGGNAHETAAKKEHLKQLDLVEDLQQRFPMCKIHREQQASAFDRITRYLENPAEMEQEEVAKLQQSSLLYGTPFQIRVWRAMARIPKTKEASYGDVCRSLGLKPSTSRAVAQACGANPLTLLFPCHRVVSANGAVGGYHWGPCIKRKILQDEKRTRFSHVKGAPIL